MSAIDRKKKQKEIPERLSWRKELRMLPCHILLWLWIGFAIVCVLWILAASLSTSGEIFRGEALKFATGFHFENYIKAWTQQNISVYFMNSLIYASISSALLIVICAPAAYVLARYTFLGNKAMKSGLVMAMSIPSFMPQMLPIIAISLTCLIAIAAIGIVSIRRISRFLTNPLNLMMRMIDEMKAYSYTNPVSPRFHDETGKLIDALNDMYSTIWEQTERIRDEEKQKYRYLSAMLTEQINPHFLYNTLETINMEIRGGKEQDASLMITDLAQFLRPLLNHGEPTITLAEELMNAEAYARIMNRRLNRKVRLDTHLDKDIEGLSVPKSILQPLVENSIKHGFSSLSPENGITDPEITICIERKDRILYISVSDNGSGIDAEKVSQAIQESEETPHVGLKNVYERLKLHFGNADLSVTSYPYFENTIRIEIAMEQ